MNTWNTQRESYQQRVYNNTLATVKCQIQQAESQTPAMVISMEAARVDNNILLDYLTSTVAFEEPGIGRADLAIPIFHNCMDGELHFGMPRGRGDNEDEGEVSDERKEIPAASQRRLQATGLEEFDPRTIDVDSYVREDGNDMDADSDQEEEGSQADDGSTRNVAD